MNPVPPNPASVLVSDFDGTMTRHDFFKLTIEHLLPPGTPDHWADWRAGRITHFEALRRYFESIRADEATVNAMVDRMEIDRDLATAVEALRAGGWRVVVASAGCDWYIRRLLAEADVSVEVHANPGRFVAGRGLLMERPVGSPYLSQELGVDKAAVVRTLLAAGNRVAFAGDGFPDVEAARLVPATLRFARADLADVLTRERLAFRPFEHWSQIARALLET